MQSGASRHLRPKGGYLLLGGLRPLLPNIRTVIADAGHQSRKLARHLLCQDIKTQLRRAEANQFLEELEGLLLRETIEEPDEGNLIGKAKPVMRAPTLAELHEIFLG